MEGWRSRGMKTFRFADTAFFNTNRTNQNKHSSRWAMHGMCCHFPNTIRSWSNTFNCLKALEYKVRKDYCVNNKKKKKSKRKEHGTPPPKKKKQTLKGENYFTIKTLCKIIILDFSSKIQLQIMYETAHISSDLTHLTSSSLCDSERMVDMLTLGITACGIIVMDMPPDWFNE